ncbi:MAG: nucleoside-diphosphate kinase [Actinomycetota bacterium]|nr:nucleoside-diphosphate kinase [Actinomycetota bacterium]
MSTSPSTSREVTLVLVKPDGVRRGLVGEVISRLERKGLQLDGLRMLTLDASTAGQHYSIHRDKPFFEELVEFITSGPLVAVAVSGTGAVAAVRNLIGPTSPLDAAPGTIRGDFATVITENLVHGSDARETAEKEIALFFPELSENGP